MSEELFKKYEDEFLCFERIPENKRLHSDSKLCGLIYLSEIHDGGYVIDGAMHDKIWLRLDDEKLTDEQILYLCRCGIHWDSEHGYLAMFA